MSTAFDVRALDSVVRVEFDGTVPEPVREVIRNQWVDLFEETAEPDVTLVASMGTATSTDDRARRTIAAGTIERLAAAIVSETTVAGIEALAGSALMLHAGAVALDDGRVIALVGPSGRGKTTASQALGRHHGYVTDETLAVYPSGEVLPYRKPLSIGVAPDSKSHVPASVRGLRELPQTPLSLAAIVILDRRDHVEAPFVESIPLLEALEELVPQTSYLPMLHDPLRTLISSAVSTGGVRRVVYSEADTLADLVGDILDTVAEEDPPLLLDVRVSTNGCDCGSAGGVAPESAPTDAGEKYRRADYRDALSVDDDLVVFSNNVVTVLRGLGPVLWLAAADSTAAELAETALREMPPPPTGADPGEVVRAAIDELLAAELLVRV